MLFALACASCFSVAFPGTLVVLQHQPGDSSRPWSWRMIIEHMTMISAAGSPPSFFRRTSNPAAE
jgi:hypothetical protein